MFERKDTKVCRGCLSSDRKLTSISADDLMLYYTLLADDRKPDALTAPCIDLCWECKGILRRAQMFRAQVQRAHKILEDMLGLPPEKATLSSLTFQHKLEYDAIFEDTKADYQSLFCKTKVPDITVDKIVIPTKYKALAKEEDEKELKDVSNSNLTKFNYDNDSTIEYISDDSDHYDNVNAEDRDSSSPELTIKRIIPQTESQDLKIFKPTNLNDVNSKRKAAPQYKVIRTNRIVKHNVHLVPIVKTPVLAKLELELQKFMQNAKKNVKNVTQESSSKQNAPKKESTERKTKNARSSNDITKFKNDSHCDDQDDLENSAEESSSEEEASASNRGRKESKRCKPELDPDFNVEEDDEGDSETEETHRKVQKEKVDDKGKKYKPKRYKKTIMRYKHINDVLSCFTEIEMSMDDVKSTLEKEDAIVDQKKPIKCSVCGMLFRLHRHLRHHALGYHKGTHPGQFRKGNYYNPPPTMPEEPRLWRCGVCSKLLRRAHVLAHMNEHHRTQYFCNGNGCEWSMKGFWIKEEHDEHWIEIHKQFVCDTCGTRKTNKSSLEYHVQTAHLNIPPQQCPHCERLYVHASALQKHIRRRHAAPAEPAEPAEPAPAERRYCVECDRTYPTVERLRQHFHRKHSEAAKKKYPCGECGRVLAQRASLRSHCALLHAGKTEHCCHICGKYFSKAQAVTNHVNSSHLNIRLPKTKPCIICGRMFQTSRILRQHMCTHTGERPYQCAHCDAAYTQPYSLRTHLAKRHGRSQVVRLVR